MNKANKNTEAETKPLKNGGEQKDKREECEKGISAKHKL